LPAKSAAASLAIFDVALFLLSFSRGNRGFWLKRWPIWTRLGYTTSQKPRENGTFGLKNSATSKLAIGVPPVAEWLLTAQQRGRLQIENCFGDF
jgi:hypothetical protein